MKIDLRIEYSLNQKLHKLWELSSVASLFTAKSTFLAISLESPFNSSGNAQVVRNSKITYISRTSRYGTYSEFFRIMLKKFRNWISCSKDKWCKLIWLRNVCSTILSVCLKFIIHIFQVQKRLTHAWKTNQIRAQVLHLNY